MQSTHGGAYIKGDDSLCQRRQLKLEYWPRAIRCSSDAGHKKESIDNLSIACSSICSFALYRTHRCGYGSAETPQFGYGTFIFSFAAATKKCLELSCAVKQCRRHIAPTDSTKNYGCEYTYMEHVCMSVGLESQTLRR